ncbi:methyltransferase dimerization domain-containing protein [Spongiactinospora sp. TRM90649]|uniref:methyltransferase family protein n=1 Tax=Spongiactinospora sp. TRM90649 TaxID=3031114 RepID=UPI0023F8F2A2|nr:methyltransferase dimerization domain-containing protein [Spongiactinospora sp. TRM90649]MDF5759088.1 methyltransferase dimerization domain-containing protein [Spongiactinospora sp. TRM90649]
MTTSPPSPHAIVGIATGYMGAKQLFAASRIGLFRALSDGPLGAAEIAQATGVTPRMARILADCMAALGLLTRTDGRYALTHEAAAYLAGDRSELDLGPFLTFLNEISYGHWLQFDKTVDTTTPGDLDMSPERWGTFMAGVMTYNALHAKMLGGLFDFSGYRELLDLGGLSSGFALEALRANTGLRATFVYDPAFADSVAEQVREAGVDDRAVVTGAPTDTAKPEGEFDLVMVNHVVHRFTAEQNLDILRNARAAAAPGARLMLLDFFLDDDPEQRALDALHAGEYLVIDGTVVYEESEVRGWLASTGWRTLDKLSLPGSPRLLLAEAV